MYRCIFARSLLLLAPRVKVGKDGDFDDDCAASVVQLNDAGLPHWVVKRRVGDDHGTWTAAMAVQRESQARDGCQSEHATARRLTTADRSRDYRNNMECQITESESHGMRNY